ncbi:MAG TPA: HepT-like ribonuclease domain-containing protein [Stellaceae bacterium]|nr:HepT-like ribonuclease domain-containing protein [Stellaceae bacterium]
MKSDLPLLGHIADSIVAIESYTAAGRDAFVANRLIQDAVIRNFEIIGEAAGRLSPVIRNQPGVPWRKIIAFRNRLIHAYWERRPASGVERDRKRLAAAQSRD